jgi:TusA-related sulfurtransferase
MTDQVSDQMTGQPSSPVASVELGRLGFDGGAHVLVKLALADVPAGARLGVQGTHPELVGDLAAWCRQAGHRLATAAADDDVVAWVERGRSSTARWVGAEQAGRSDPGETGALAARPPAHWGLAARGTWVEAGGPEPSFPLAARDEVWAERAPRLYAQAAAAQWDPATAIDWSAPIDHDDRVEAAVVQVMTYLVENEQAALVVPARFLGQVHPHFREIQQVLATIAADEARHVEVFSRRAHLGGRPLSLSSVGGRASLQTLLDEPDFATASFLLSTMGEGTFLSLLGFLERQAPDPVTRQVTRLARQDEARHVAFSLGHLERHANLDPSLRARLARAVERRHDALRTTAGLNDEVFDALVLLAAGAPEPEAVARGWAAVQALQADMDEGRRSRLHFLGFSATEAESISALHTRNFM